MPSVMLVYITGGIVLGLLLSQAQAEQCEPAGSAVEVRAHLSGSDALTVSYTVVNNTRSGIAWIRIGSAGPERTQLIPQQTPVIKSAPTGWAGAVVYPEETPDMHLWWEMKDGGAALQPGTTASGFVVQVPGPTTVQPGLRGVDGRLVRPIDFGSLPFSVGGTGMQCWWGRVRSMAGPHARQPA
jgi:hypothetical protein